jgi:hypothetical protein
MQLIYKSFVAAAAVAFSAAAAAQTIPSTSNGTTNPTVPQSVPDEPGQPAQSPPPQTPPSQTPSAENPSAQSSDQTAGQSGQVAAATAADVKAGTSVYDQSGSVVGKIKSVSKDNAVVDTGTVRAQVPITSLGKNDKGLVINMTKSELDAAAKKKTSPPK